MRQQLNIETNHTKKSLGQNFITDKNFLEKIRFLLRKDGTKLPEGESYSIEDILDYAMSGGYNLLEPFSEYQSDEESIMVILISVKVQNLITLVQQAEEEHLNGFI